MSNSPKFQKSDVDSEEDYFETKTWICTGDRGEFEFDEGETRKRTP